jgi:hypothetical protein
MKIEDQVCSFKQSLKFEELGCTFMTAWVRNKNRGIWLRRACPSNHDKVYSAPTVAELGVLLPSTICTGITDASCYCLSYDRWHPDKDHKHAEFGVSYSRDFKNEGLLFKRAKTEAQVRAKALIWLIKKGYLKPEDLKL